MPTNDELQAAREGVEHHKQVYDAHLMDTPVNWENIAAMVSGITDAQAVYIAALEAAHAAQQQRIAELAALVSEYQDVLQNTLAPHALPDDDMETVVRRVLKRIETLERALEPFAALGDLLANSPYLHPDYKRKDRPIYGLNTVELMRGDFVRAYNLLHGEAQGE